MATSTDDQIAGSSRYGSRKFLLTAAALASATFLVYTGHISDGVYSAIVLGALAAYITGNVSQTNAEKTAAAEVTKAIETAKISSAKAVGGGSVLS